MTVVRRPTVTPPGYHIVYRGGIPYTEPIQKVKPKPGLGSLYAGAKPPTLIAVKKANPSAQWAVAKAGGQSYPYDPMVSGGLRSNPLPTGPPPVTPGPAADGGDPWKQYTDQLDARERAAYAEAARLRGQQTQGYMESLTGFGKALQENAAQQWGKVIESYGRAGNEATAYGNTFADSYGQGLTDANRRMAQDFAAIGQEGDPAIRNDQAALDQIRTQGGARPGETMGLVGRAWGSYGETRPGTLGFVTEQNLRQVVGEALQADSQAQVDLIKDLADNPQQAMQMWQVAQSWKDSKTKAEADSHQQEFENQVTMAKNAREERALGLNEATVRRQMQQALEDAAWNRTNATGRLWTVKNGRLVDSRRPAPGSAAGRARTQAATSRYGTNVRANTAAASLAAKQAHDSATEAISNAKLAISQQQANTATKRAGDYGAYLDWKKKHPRAGKTKTGPGGFSQATVKDWMATSGKSARDAFYGIKNPKYAADPDHQPKWLMTPQRPSKVLSDLIAMGIPFQIAIKSIQAYGRQKNAGPGWKATLNWTKKKAKAPGTSV